MGPGRSRTRFCAVQACDLLLLYDGLFRPTFAFFIVRHGTREVAHVGLTRAPTDSWTARQLRNATPSARTKSTCAE